MGFILIPDSIIIAPRKEEKGLEIYGATWRPVGLNLPIKMNAVKFSVGAGVLISYIYFNMGSFKIVDKEQVEDDDQKVPP